MSPVIWDGKVALYRKRGLQADRSVIVNGRTYVFKPRGGVGLAWVSDTDVDAVLAIRQKCCGGQTTPEFAYANEAQAQYWVEMNGGQYT